MTIKTRSATRIDSEKVVELIERMPLRETSSGMKVCHGFELEEDLLRVATVADLWMERGHQTRWANRLDPGCGPVPQHIHNEWDTVIYYPREHHIPLLVPIPSGALEPLFPGKDQLVYLPAGSSHGVLKGTESPRYSVVFLYAKA